MTATMHKLSAGDGYTYLTNQVAMNDATEWTQRDAMANYYLEKGERPGQWRGRGLASLGLKQGEKVTEAQMKALFGEGIHPNADALLRAAIKDGLSKKDAIASVRLGRRFTSPNEKLHPFVVEKALRFRAWNEERGRVPYAEIPANVRSQIVGEIGQEFFRKEFGRAPSDGRELNGYLARASRPRSQSVAGFDLTFSPVKSVSTLWALAPPEVAEEVARAHHAAVARAMDWMENEVAFTRRGVRGVRQTDVEGLITAWFDHRDSRAGDPDLHTHVVISNKVRDVADGKWLSLDGSLVYRAMVAVSEQYNTALEAELGRRLGLQFAPLEQVQDKRPIREVVGVEAAVNEMFSARRAAIEQRQAELAAAFTSQHGRAPLPRELLTLAQRANLDTRAAKHEPRSLAEQRDTWRRQARSLLGSETAVDSMIVRALNMPRREVNELNHDAVARDTLAMMERTRSTWAQTHVRAEALRRIRGFGLTAEMADQVADAITDRVLLAPESVLVTRVENVEEPAVLRRKDGRSVYERAHSRYYTSRAVIEAEQLVLDAARRTDGRICPEEQVGLALLESTANGVELNDGQAAMVHQMAESGARVQLALAPAGSGKTTALGVLARAWISNGGRVVGLAPSAVAARGLGEVMNGHGETISSLTHRLRTSGPLPGWANQVDATSLIIIDEAGMASTVDLAATISWALGRGASVRLVGDDRQLSAIESGGLLRDIDAEIGASRLHNLVRFADPAEAAATLGVREGRHESLGFYLDRGRIEVVDESLKSDMVFDNWYADRRAGMDSLMLASTNDQVTELNAKARSTRVQNEGKYPGSERVVALASGLEASAGDTIITRANDRRLRLNGSDFVKNGDRWLVKQVNRDGSLLAQHVKAKRQVVLPAEYVARSVDLGYAVTVHGAQGVTVDSAHVVVDGSETREMLYVALSRGRHTNRLYVSTGGPGDDHNRVYDEVVVPQTATDQLLAILDHEGSQHSARTQWREQREPDRVLADRAGVYADVLVLAALTELGPERVDRLCQEAERITPGVTDELAWDTLLAHLAYLEIEGYDSIEMLAEAAASRTLHGVRDTAAVLDWRLDTSQRQGLAPGPLPWLRSIPPTLKAHTMWGPYLEARAVAVTQTAAIVRRNMEDGPYPAWASGITNSRLRGDVAVWRAAMRVPEGDQTPLGPPQPRANERRYQDELAEKLGENEIGKRWMERIRDFDERVVKDGYWRVLGRNLDRAHVAGADVAAALTTAFEEGPLPDDLPAAALWSRLVPGLATAIAQTDHGPRLRPAFTQIVLDHLPEGIGEHVLHSPQWPTLAATISDVPDEQRADVIEAAVALAPVRGTQTSEVADLPTRLSARIQDLLAPPGEEDLPPDGDEAAPAEAPLDLWHHSRSWAQASPTPLHWEQTAAPESDRQDIQRETGEPADAESVEDPAATTSLDPQRKARIVALHDQAAQFYAQHYQGSSAAAYVASRFGGDDLTSDDRITIGYAPPGWANLTDHLTANGATTDELVEAGLAKYARHGTVIDVFRDRVVVGIRDQAGDLVGFSGRAAPGSDPQAPKYLNTPTTPAFTKGALLFGYAENADRLAAGATPVRVEGVFDAIAVTRASGGNAVGVAPMGTALTEAQAAQLAAAGATKPMLVATDTDTAGRGAARKDYWTLARYGVDARRLVLVDPTDPAASIKDPSESFQRDQGVTLGRITASPEVAPTLLSEVVTHTITAASQRALIEQPGARISLVREVAEAIAVAPTTQWAETINQATDQIVERTQDASDDATTWFHQLLTHEVTTAAEKWQPGPPAQNNPHYAQLHQLGSRITSHNLSKRAAAIARNHGKTTPVTVAGGLAATRARLEALAQRRETQPQDDPRTRTVPDSIRDTDIEDDRQIRPSAQPRTLDRDDDEHPNR